MVVDDPFRVELSLLADTRSFQYACFVEGCERSCATPYKRRRHLIDKHMYPKNFFFAVTRDGIDGRRSLLVDGGRHRRRKSSISVKKEERRKSSVVDQEMRSGGIAEGEAEEKRAVEATRDEKAGTEAQADSPDTEMDDLAGAMSSLKFVPPAVKFGRGGRAGFSRR